MSTPTSKGRAGRTCAARAGTCTTSTWTRPHADRAAHQDPERRRAAAVRRARLPAHDARDDTRSGGGGKGVTVMGTTALREWGNFFVIVGSSAGALTGLQFVVLTLIANAGPLRAS